MAKKTPGDGSARAKLRRRRLDLGYPLDDGRTPRKQPETAIKIDPFSETYDMDKFAAAQKKKRRNRKDPS